MTHTPARVKAPKLADPNRARLFAIVAREARREAPEWAQTWPKLRRQKR